MKKEVKKVKNNKKNNPNTKKENNVTKKKSDKIVLSVLFGVIVLLIIITIIVRNSDYYNSKTYTYDYLKFLVSEYYDKSTEQENYLVKKDKDCYIEYNSLIMEKTDLLNYGKIVKINNQDWVKQDFDNGVTWMSYYKNSLYIVQMYGKDNATYVNECKKDFEKVKSSFSFMKSE